MKFSGNKWIPFILTVIVIVLLNVAASTLPFRADLTRNGVYSLSEASKEAVSTLEEPLTIKAFLSESLSPPYNNTEQTLRDLLEEYSIEANRYFNYSIISIPSKEKLDSGEGSEAEDEANKYRIFPIQIQTVEQDEVKLQSVYMGVAFIHGDMIETIPALTNTSNLEYQITGIINEMGRKISALLSMKEDIQVTLYLSENMMEVNSAFADRREGLETAVDELNEQYYGRLEFEVVDPVAAGGEDVIENEYGVSPLNLSRQTDAGTESEKGYAALVITHQGRNYTQNLMSRGIFGWQVRDMDSLKQTIEDVTETIIGTNEELGFASGYGMPSLGGQENNRAPASSITPELSNFNTLMSREYTLETVSLPENDIPEGLGCLVIAGPAEELSDYDLYKIDQFLLKGGSLALFLDPFSVFMAQSQQFGQQQQPQYIPRETGLEDMLAHYGVDLKQAYVLDEQSFTQRQRTSSGSIVETPVYYAPIISEERISDELEILQNIPELVLLYTAPLELNNNLRDETSAIPVITSSADSWVMEEDINLAYPQLLEPPEDDMQSSQVLAYLLEGEFESYFSSKAVPQPPEPEEGEVEQPDDAASKEVIARDAVELQETMRESGAGKIFVMGSSAVLGSNVLDTEGQSGNSLFFMNMFDYLNGREDYAVMRTKGVNYAPIREDISAQTKSFVKTFNIAVMPALVVVAGVLVWAGRMRRKKRIELYFLKRGEHAE